MYIAYEIKSWSYYFDNCFILRNSSFDCVKLTKNVDRDKYSYSGYSVSFDERETFSLPHGSFNKNVAVFDVNMGSSVHTGNNEKRYLNS